jgi:multisubunit Na+/H+ antiporter MnhB subunit
MVGLYVTIGITTIVAAIIGFDYSKGYPWLVRVIVAMVWILAALSFGVSAYYHVGKISLFWMVVGVGCVAFGAVPYFIKHWRT